VLLPRWNERETFQRRTLRRQTRKPARRVIIRRRGQRDRKEAPSRREYGN
jgi:hypothetical protein